MLDAEYALNSAKIVLSLAEKLLKERVTNLRLKLGGFQRVHIININDVYGPNAKSLNNSIQYLPCIGLGRTNLKNQSTKIQMPPWLRQVERPAEAQCPRNRQALGSNLGGGTRVSFCIPCFVSRFILFFMECGFVGVALVRVSRLN